jgi:ABC-type sugar transport system substrate-binding protein
MRKKTEIALALIFALLFGAVDRADDLPKFKAGLSMSFLGSPFFVALTTLTTSAAKAAGLNWMQPTDAQSDPGKQISDIQSLVNSGVKGLIVVPRDSDAIAPALQYASSKGVAVVAVDVGINKGKAAITVRADNVSMARTACEATGSALGGKGKILELQGDLLNSSGRDRTEGFESCMKQKYPHIAIIARPTRWEQARAADAAQTILTVNPDLAAIYMESGSIMLPGVLSVLHQAGRNEKAGDPHKIFLVGIDGSPYELQKIRSGELDATVSQPMNLYAQLSVEYLRMAVKGIAFVEGPTSHDSKIVKSSFGNLEDLLSSPLVTKKNVDDRTLWGNMAGSN